MTNQEIARYLNLDPFDDEEGVLTCRTKKLVRTRKLHECACCRSIIPVGNVARYDSHLVDGGSFVSMYHCLTCLETEYVN